jgi:DNA-binding HxlR family transcriptional regulator
VPSEGSTRTDDRTRRRAGTATTPRPGRASPATTSTSRPAPTSPSGSTTSTRPPRLDRPGPCSIQRTLEIVGERWTLLVLREAFYGLRRFDEFQRGLGCARNILSNRLATLVDHGLLTRRPYREPGQRPRDEYRLTEKGLELFPVIIALMRWGDRWEADADGPPIVVRHSGCDAPVEAVLRCEHGHEPLTARETYGSLGPGAEG